MKQEAARKVRVSGVLGQVSEARISVGLFPFLEIKDESRRLGLGLRGGALA